MTHEDKTRTIALELAEGMQTNGEATSPADAPARKGGPSQATRLVLLAANAELFHDGDTEYATIGVDDHLETHKVRSARFKSWLRRRYYERFAGAPGAQAVEDALSTLESRARFGGPEIRVHLRLAEFDDAIYLDLCDHDWRAIRIDGDGWKIVERPPVRFRRAKGMQPLPVPLSGGSVHALRRFLNVEKEDDFVLMIGWEITALRPTRPKPVLALSGEQGSAKSTTERILRRLSDPNDCDLRKDVRDLRDLAIAANNSRIVALDNMSHLPAWLSDGLCSLATGGGFATRKLYSDDEETLFNAQRPILLNGIAEVATRPDLLDRTIIIAMPAIGDEQRLTEERLWAEFEEAQPAIFGGLLDAVSCALRRLPEVARSTKRRSRMADFEEWVTAAEPALGLEPGEFSRIYARNRDDADALALEASPVAAPLVRIVETEGEWSGSASDLLKRLSGEVEEATTRKQGWPKDGTRLGAALRKIAPNLRRVGVEVVFERESRRRFVRIRQGMQNSVTSVTSVTTLDPQGFANDADCDADDAGPDASVTTAALFDGPCDADDANDAKTPPLSDWAETAGTELPAVVSDPFGYAAAIGLEFADDVAMQTDE